MESEALSSAIPEQLLAEINELIKRIKSTYSSGPIVNVFSQNIENLTYNVIIANDAFSTAGINDHLMKINEMIKIFVQPSMLDSNIEFNVYMVYSQHGQWLIYNKIMKSAAFVSVITESLFAEMLNELIKMIKAKFSSDSIVNVYSQNSGHLTNHHQINEMMKTLIPPSMLNSIVNVYSQNSRQLACYIIFANDAFSSVSIDHNLIETNEVIERVTLPFLEYPAVNLYSESGDHLNFRQPSLNQITEYFNSIQHVQVSEILHNVVGYHRRHLISSKTVTCCTRISKVIHEIQRVLSLKSTKTESVLQMNIILSEENVKSYVLIRNSHHQTNIFRENSNSCEGILTDSFYSSGIKKDILASHVQKFRHSVQRASKAMGNEHSECKRRIFKKIDNVTGYDTGFALCVYQYDPTESLESERCYNRSSECNNIGDNLENNRKIQENYRERHIRKYSTCQWSSNRSHCNWFRAFVISTLAFVMSITTINCEKMNVTWAMATDPIIFGKSANLTCIISGEENCLFEYLQWYGGQKHKLLCRSGACRNGEKYLESNEFPCRFTLEISNFSEDDVNVEYTCLYKSLHHRKMLALDKQHFQYIPGKQEITMNNNSDTERHDSVIVDIETVYPFPVCNMTYRKENISDFVMVKQKEKGLFYSVTFNISYKPEKCLGLLEITCKIGKTLISFLNGTLLYCKDGSEISKVAVTGDGFISNTGFPGDNPISNNGLKKSTVVKITAISVVVGILLIGICIAVKISRRPKRSRKQNDECEELGTPLKIVD